MDSSCVANVSKNSSSRMRQGYWPSFVTTPVHRDREFSS